MQIKGGCIDRHTLQYGKRYYNNDYFYSESTWSPFTFCKFANPGQSHNEAMEVEPPVRIALECEFNCKSLCTVPIPSLMQRPL